MIWIRLSISCIMFLSITGSISFGIIKISKKPDFIANPILLLSLQKLALMLYWIPISFVCICISRISYENGVKAYRGEFACSTAPNMTRAFNVIGSVWFAGFLLFVVLDALKIHKLFKLEKGNVYVKERRYLTIFEECSQQFNVKNVSLSQNDLITAPITAGLFRKRIILPFAQYTDTELRMVYQHELTHIKNKDMFWRMMGLVTSWIHWFNPVVYFQLRELDCFQEMVCDLSISIKNAHFTKKEYAVFLAKLTDNEMLHTCTIALTENKNQTIRRIEKMKKTSHLDNPSRRVIGLSCAGLIVMALLPATAVSAKTARLQEDWMRAEEVIVEEEPQDWADTSIEEHSYADGSVFEIEDGLELVPRSSSVDLEKTIAANTRYVYEYRSIQAGTSIVIAAKCDDSSITYKIGIKNKETGALTSISGQGELLHTFKIAKSGNYAAYVENNGNVPMNVTGAAVYY